MYYFANQIDGAGPKMYSGVNETGSILLNDMGSSQKKYDAVIEILDGIDFDSILDVGCGDGELLHRLVGDKRISAFGVDNSEKMIATARKKLGGDVELFACDYAKLPWRKNSFDVVVCDGLLCRFSDPEDVIHEMKRVIKHGGSLVIIGVGRIGRIRRLFDLRGAGDTHNYSKYRVINLLGRSGFFVEDWIDTKARGFVLRALAIR